MKSKSAASPSRISIRRIDSNLISSFTSMLSEQKPITKNSTTRDEPTALQPKSITGPIFLFGCTPIVAPVSSLAIEHAAVPQCQNVIVFSLSSRDTGSPKNTACSDNFIPIYIESAPYVSASQLAATPISFSIASTPQTGVPNAVKKSGQHLEESAPILFSSTYSL